MRSSSQIRIPLTLGESRSHYISVNLFSMAQFSMAQSNRRDDIGVALKKVALQGMMYESLTTMTHYYCF